MNPTVQIRNLAQIKVQRRKRALRRDQAANAQTKDLMRKDLRRVLNSALKKGLQMKDLKKRKAPTKSAARERNQMRAVPSLGAKKKSARIKSPKNANLRSLSALNQTRVLRNQKNALRKIQDHLRNQESQRNARARKTLTASNSIVMQSSKEN